MKGKHHIVIESKHVKYEFDIRRNITIIQGDSATGKTTLVDMLSAYASDRDSSGVRMESDVNCSVVGPRMIHGERSFPLTTTRYSSLTKTQRIFIPKTLQILFK